MKSIYGIIAYLLLLTANAETMGWRIPLSHVTSGLLEAQLQDDAEIPVLQEAPGPSAFFKKGDRLFDISDIVWARLQYYFAGEPDPVVTADSIPTMIPKRYQCEWVVWNQRSETLVARGDLVALEILQASLTIEAIPGISRCTVQLEQLGGEKELVSVAGRSGERQTARNKVLSVKVAPSFSNNRRLTDISYYINYSPARGRVYEIQSAMVLTSPDPVIVASWQEGDQGWRAHLSCVILTSYNVSFYDLHLIEMDGVLRKVSELGPRPYSLKSLAMGDDGLYYRRFLVPPNFIEQISYDESGSDLDPFKPAETHRRTATKPLDAMTALRANGVKFQDAKSIAVFSAADSTLHIVNDAVNLDLIEQIVGGGCGEVLLVHTNFDWELGAGSLISRSGERSAITTIIRGEEHPLLEIAPNVASGHRIIDVNCFLEPVSKVFSLSTALTLTNEHPLPLARFTNQGDEHEVTVAAKVLEAHVD